MYVKYHSPSDSVCFPFRWNRDAARRTTVRAQDCNNNGVDDLQDIVLATSQDCNTNAIPDECELPDHDCDLNGVPDDCQQDSDGSGIIDACDNCGLQLTDNDKIDRWGTRQKTTSGGRVIWADEDDSIHYFDGTQSAIIQTKDPLIDSLGNVETSVFTLGSGANPGEVIGAWRRGSDFGWVWSNDGNPPRLIDYVNPYDDNQPMNPEGVAAADGCLFMILQAFDPNTNVLIKHVYKIDVASGESTLLTDDFLSDVDNAAQGAYVTNLYTNRCRAAWNWCSASENGSCVEGALQIHYFDGSDVSVIDDNGILHGFADGRIIYTKEINGLSQLFLYDANLPNPASRQITSLTSGDKRIIFAQTDGRHVAILLADENGQNREIQWLGGFAFTDDATRPSDQPLAQFLPLKLDRGQLLWQDKGGSFRVFDGHAIGTICHDGWLADGHVAMLRKSATTGDDVEVWLSEIAPLDDAIQPSPPHAIEALATDNNEVTLRWEPILGATSYNVYFARQSGVDVSNFATLEDGAFQSGFVENTATISGLAGDSLWYFVVTAIQDSAEGPSSKEVSATPCVDPVADRDHDAMPDCVDDDPDHAPSSNDNTSNDNESNDNTANDNTSNDNSTNDNANNDNTTNDNAPGGTTPPPDLDDIANCGTGLCGAGVPFMLTLSMISLGMTRHTLRQRKNLIAFRSSCVVLLAISVIALFLSACDAAPDLDNEPQPSDLMESTWNDRDGLTLSNDVMTLFVPPDVLPSNLTLTMAPINADDSLPDGVPAGAGFDVGAIFGPSGTTFSGPVLVTAKLSAATPLDTLPVLLLDDATGRWGWAGTNATMDEDGITASFELTHFSGYRFWNPPPPTGDLPIGDDEIIAGTGFFEGQPFNSFPSPESADASLAYSPFGDAFGLSIVQTDLTNPATGDFFTLIAGLHASRVGNLEKAKVGIVTPAGGLSGVSAFVDGVSPAKGISGIMYLRKSATHWMVDVYCAYEGGIVFGQATGER
ncbi:MAG: fibronectin type III domain-containing protein [Planctomycetes bacterium]|nr:fibronectin type III domain-containing protein [Planctomycetota bacterium]